MIVKRWLCVALCLAGVVPCFWLASCFLDRQDAAHGYKIVFAEGQENSLPAAGEMPLELRPEATGRGALRLTVYCRDSCGGLVARLPGQLTDIAPLSRESHQVDFAVPPGLAGRVLLRNPTSGPVVVTGYRFKNYLVSNSEFPRLVLLLPGGPGPGMGWGWRLAWLLLALALQLGGLGAAAGARRRGWACALVLAPPWLALAAGLWLGRDGSRLILSGEALATLAGVGGLVVASLRWARPAGRRLTAWVRGPLAGLLAQPADPGGQGFLERWAAPILYGVMGAYLAYAAIFSLLPGWRAQEWTVARYTWLVMAALLAGFLAAWRLGWLAWLGRLGSLPAWSILLIALLPRLAWALFSGVKQGSDCAYFAHMAMDVYRGAYFLLPYKEVGPEAVYKGIYWLVGTGPSIVAAGAYWLVGPYQQAALSVVALVSTLEVYLVYRIALSLWDRRVAALASLILALCPTHLLFVNQMGSDVYFSFFVTLTFFLVSRFRDRLGDLLWAFLGGLSLGASQWMRPTMPLFLVSLLTPLVMRWERRPRKLAWLTGSLLLGLFLVLTPIVEHNWDELGIFSVNPSQMGGWSLLVGANLKSRGWYTFTDVHLLQDEVTRRTVPPGMNPLLFAERVSLELTFKRIAADPLGYLWLAVLHKPLSLWGRTAHLRHSLMTSVLGLWMEGIETVANYYYKLIMALAVGALLWGGLRRRLPTGVLFSLTLAALLTSASHTVLEVQPRYHFMFLPWLALLAASWASLSRRS